MKTAAEMAKLADEATLMLSARDEAIAIAEDLTVRIERHANTGQKRIIGLRYYRVESSSDEAFRGALIVLNSLGYTIDYLDMYDQDLESGYVWVDIHWGADRG